MGRRKNNNKITEKGNVKGVSICDQQKSIAVILRIIIQEHTCILYSDIAKLNYYGLQLLSKIPD